MIIQDLIPVFVIAIFCIAGVGFISIICACREVVAKRRGESGLPGPGGPRRPQSEGVGHGNSGFADGGGVDGDDRLGFSRDDDSGRGGCDRVEEVAVSQWTW